MGNSFHAMAESLGAPWRRRPPTGTFGSIAMTLSGSEAASARRRRIPVGILCRSGVQALDVAGPMELFSEASRLPVASYGKSQTICSEAGGDHWYRVVTGAARKFTVMSDGRRRIVDFLLPGDYFGFGERHHQLFATDALIDGTTVARYSRGRLEAAADRDPSLAREIRDIVLDAMSRSHARLLSLGRVRSVEKVGAFLTEMAERLDDGRDTVVLPMSRYDIADYLALSVETVSRALTRLRQERAIRFVDKHRVAILDRDRLDCGLCGYAE
jgi:CRP-like cAMP-binding protein